MSKISGSSTPNTDFIPSSATFTVAVTGGPAFLEACESDGIGWVRVSKALEDGRFSFTNTGNGVRYRLQFRPESCAAEAFDAAAVQSAGAVVQAIPDYPSAEALLAAYGNFDKLSPGDFVTRLDTSNGQTIVALSGSPMTPGESRVDMNVEVTAPCSLDIEASCIRNRQQFATISLYADGPNGPDVVPTPVNIVSISQSNAVDGAAYSGTAGTTCTIVLENALPGEGQAGRVFLSDWVNITGLDDTRLNYQNATISFISADRKTICFGFSDEAALPSLAVPVVTPTLGTAKVNFYNNAAGAAHGAGFRFTGTTATSAAVWSMFGGGDAQISGTLLGDHRVGIGNSTAPVYSNGKMGQYELAATSRYRIDVTPDEVTFYSRPRDTPWNSWSPIVMRSGVKPGVTERLKARFRLFQPPGMSRPVAKIVSIAKTGTTTATVITDAPHGLAVSNVVGVNGVRDQTNFANANTTVISVVDATTFTAVVGSAVTASSRGGIVTLMNGSAVQPGLITQAVSSVANKADNAEWLQVVGNASWSGLNVGDYIDLQGVIVDATGVSAAVDGPWEFAGQSTTTMWLKPIVDIKGVRVSPATPTFAGTVNCGGAVILRTTLRSHDLMLKQSLGEALVKVDGQGTGRQDKSLPVQVVTGIQGFSPNDAVAIGNPMGVGFVARNANPSAVSATGDVVNALATMVGALVSKPYSIPEAEWSGTVALSTTTATAVVAAAGAGLRRHITALQAINTGAAAVDLIILDGANERWRLPLPVNVPVAVQFPTGLTTTSATAVNANLSAAGTVRINAQGYTAP